MNSQGYLKRGLKLAPDIPDNRAYFRVWLPDPAGRACCLRLWRKKKKNKQTAA
jgi:hypothetical protein